MCNSGTEATTDALKCSNSLVKYDKLSFGVRSDEAESGWAYVGKIRMEQNVGQWSWTKASVTWLKNIRARTTRFHKETACSVKKKKQQHYFTCWDKFPDVKESVVKYCSIVVIGGSLHTLHVTETLSGNGMRKFSTLFTNLHKFTYKK
jgi:hypothetical protein